MRQEGIPSDLKRLPQWVCWAARWEPNANHPNGGTWKKVPFDPRSGRQAKVDDSGTWTTFECAIAAYKRGKYDGIGFVFTGDDPYFGIDLDGCRNPDTGKISPSAWSIIGQINSYVEVSPSGTGVKIIGRGTLPDGAGNVTGKGSRHKCEVYDHGRFFTITGHTLPGHEVIRVRQRALTNWHAATFPPPTIAPATPITTTTTIEDDELIDSLRQHHPRFSALFDRGDLSGNRNNPSDADMSLANILANRSADADQVDRIMRRSALLGDPNRVRKWDTIHYSATGETYGQHTVRGAVATRRVSPIPTTAPPITSAMPCPDLIAEVARLRAEVSTKDDALTAATMRIAELEEENTALITLTTNPVYGPMAPTVIRTATRYLKSKREGTLDERGFARVTLSGIGDDHAGDESDAPPIKARSTVKRHHDKMTGVGMEREVRMERVEVATINKRTGEHVITTIPTPVSWVRFTGETLTEMLQPFALFTAPPKPTAPAFDLETPAYGHGGDRRSERYQATRTPCPDCGSTERVIYCKSCSLNITELVEGEEADPVFQDVALRKRPTGGGSVAPVFESGTREIEDTDAPINHHLWEESADDGGDDVDIALGRSCTSCGVSLPEGWQYECPDCRPPLPIPHPQWERTLGAAP